MSTLSSFVTHQSMNAYKDISIPLLPDQSYHIYNRGNEKRPIYFEYEDYIYFLNKYHSYMSGYVHTEAYCLLENHFHLAIQLESAEQIIDQAVYEHNIRVSRKWHRRYVMSWISNLISKDASLTLEYMDTYDLETLRSLMNSECFGSPYFDVHPPNLEDMPFKTQLASHIVNEKLRRFLLGYAKRINYRYNRTGSLFQKPFRRKYLQNEVDVQCVIAYIHKNPVHHGISKDMNYEFSSYNKSLNHSNVNIPSVKSNVKIHNPLTVLS